MDKDRTAERLYNEKEIGALIQRATELHEEAKGMSSGGLTLEEVERIAVELGLPPEHVKAAAQEVLEHAGAGHASNLWGGPFVLDQAQIVDASLTDDLWEHAVLELRRFTGNTGHASRLGRAREWTYSAEDGGVVLHKTLVTMREKDDRTSIRIRKQFGGGAAVAYIAGFAIAATATGIALDGSGLSDLVTLAVFLGGGTGGLAAARASLSVWTRRQANRLKQLSTALQNALADSQPRRVAEAQMQDRNDVREHVERPEHAGSPEHSRSPEHAGSPEKASSAEHAGSPEKASSAEHAESPEKARFAEQKGSGEHANILDETEQRGRGSAAKTNETGDSAGAAPRRNRN